MTTDRIALVADGLGAVAEQVDGDPGDALSDLLQLESRRRPSAMERRSMKLCRADAASRSASSSTPTTSPRGGQHRHVPQAAFEHLHQHGLGGQIGGDGSGRRAHHRCDRHVDGQTRGDHPGAQVAIGEDAEVAVGQPDQRVGHVVLGHLHDGVAHRCVGSTSSTSPCTSSATGRLSVAGATVGRSARLTAPRRRRQERQTRRLGELRPHQCAGQPDQACSAPWCGPRTPFRRRSAAACSRRCRPARRCR